MRRKGLWLTLERLLSLEAVLAEWQIELGPDFINSKPFLRPTSEQSRVYPCTNRPPCGCYHKVIDHAPDRLVAACRCEPSECETIKLQPKDIIVFRLDRLPFCRALHAVLDFDASPDENTFFPFAPRTWPVGTFSASRSPVYFSACQTEEMLLKEIEGIITANDAPFILLAPTPQFKTQAVQAVLQRQKSEFIALSQTLALKTPEKFTPISPIQPILNQFKNRLAEGPGLVKTVEALQRSMSDIARNKDALIKENKKLQAIADNKALAFLEHIDPIDIKYFLAICREKNRDKAALFLNIPKRTFHDHVNKWKLRGKEYKRMFDLVLCLKKHKTRYTRLPASLQYAESNDDDPENPDTIDFITNSPQMQAIYTETFNDLPENLE